MVIYKNILEKKFTEFAKFIRDVDERPFKSFKESGLIEGTENYKYSVYNEAREKLGVDNWKASDIGTGKIHNAVSSAIKTRVRHNGITFDNNLVSWREKDDFLKIRNNKTLEQSLFNFYSDSIPDKQSFENFVREKLSYRFIAYLFFIKDRTQYLPILQTKFDEIFDEFGVIDFKTSHRLSWENYQTFIDIIRQVQKFLLDKDGETTLIDAHSFMWVFGNQIKNPKFASPRLVQDATQKSLNQGLSPIQHSYLFAWNPDKWKWDDLESNIEEINNKGTTSLRWSCRSHKSIKIGDRAFLIRLGDVPRGIMASGYVVSEPFLSKHWSGEDKNVPRVLIEFEIILNPAKETILTLDLLKTGNLVKQHWTPQASGISIQDDCVEELEEVWFNFLATKDNSANPFAKGDNETTFIEGAPTSVIQTRYERNPHARAACLKHYGYSCLVCTFNFVSKYGELGKNFIHVHHLTQIATLGKSYKVNPIQDLRPVCPNCHAMLHKTKPSLTIEELKSLLL